MGNNKIWISLLALVFLLSGCGGEAAGGAPQKSAPEAGPVSFVAGMGCTDPNCTDPGHHHDCPVDCADYEHHHNCTLDCAEPSHNHAPGHHDEPGIRRPGRGSVSFRRREWGAEVPQLHGPGPSTTDVGGLGGL